MGKPFIKWAGGKRQLLPSILQRLPSTMGTYFEPFLGGGAVFFALQEKGAFQSAVLNDVNPELVSAYQTIADPLLIQGVIDLLNTYTYDKEDFLALRAKEVKDLSATEACARFIYLNKTAFNGLYRVNKSGKFNTPFGKYSNPKICDELTLRSAGLALQGVTVGCLDFEKAVEGAKEGDVVYFDPPYFPTNLTSSFVAYSSGGFHLADHQRLVALFTNLANRGVKVLLSNSNVPMVNELFKGFQIDEVNARRAINAKAALRGLVSEVLVHANLLVAVPAGGVKPLPFAWRHIPARDDPRSVG